MEGLAGFTTNLYEKTYHKIKKHTTLLKESCAKTTLKRVSF